MPMPPRRRARVVLFHLAVLGGCAAPAIELTRPVRFVGAAALSEPFLRDQIAPLLGVEAPAAADEAALLRAAADLLRDAYHARGYADAAVTAAAESDGTLVFTVQEGRRFTIRELSVAGCTVFPETELVRRWHAVPGPNGESQPATLLAPGDPFDPGRLETWTRRVLARYVDAGFLDARVQAPEVTRDEAEGTVAVVLRVAHEGPRYTIEAYEVPDGVRALLGDDMPPDPSGEPCTRARAEAFAAAILQGLRRRGHAQPDLRVSAVRDQDAATVTLHLAVEAGPARNVSEVVVRGNRRVPRDLIRDKFGMRPGARFDGDRERFGIAALSATGEFDRVTVDYETIDADSMRVALDVEETSGLVLQGSPYVHPWRRLGYNLFVEERDALGERHDLLAHVHVGYRGYHFGGRYLRSGLFGDENLSLTAGGDFYYNERPLFKDRGAGGTLELRRYFSPGLSVAASYSVLEHFKTTFDRTVSTAGRDYTEGRAALALEFDQTDNRLLPTRGQRAFAKLDRVDEALGADVEFTRLRVGAGVWLPLSARVRWSLEADSGFLWPSGPSAGVPVPERFFLGGYDSVRSFRESRLGPAAGGEFKNFARTELVVRTIEPLDVALFADAGNVGRDVSDWSLDRMRYALGLALRLVARETGPVVLSAAFNPDRERGEDEWVVDFAAGVNF